MNYKNAIDVIKENYPDSGYSELKEALDLAIELMETEEEIQRYKNMIVDLTELYLQMNLLDAYEVTKSFRTIYESYFQVGKMDKYKLTEKKE